MDKKSLVNILGGGALAFGAVAVAAPGVMHSGYGMTSTPTSRSLLRLWGTRTATMGLLAMRSQGKALDEWLGALAVMNGLDAALDLASLGDGVPARTATSTAATSAVFGALMLVARSMK